MLEKFKSWIISAVKFMLAMIVLVCTVSVICIVLNSILAILIAAFGVVLGTIFMVLFEIGVCCLIVSNKKPISLELEIDCSSDKEQKVGEEIVTEPV